MHQMVRSATNKPGEGKVALGWVGRRVELLTQGGRGRPLFKKTAMQEGRKGARQVSGRLAFRAGGQQAQGA